MFDLENGGEPSAETVRYAIEHHVPDPAAGSAWDVAGDIADEIGHMWAEFAAMPGAEMDVFTEWSDRWHDEVMDRVFTEALHAIVPPSDASIAAGIMELEAYANEH